MKGTNLGELEEIILLVVLNLSAQAYGLSIKNYINSHCGRKVSLSTVHATLHRLEEKGFLRSGYDHSNDQKRGGRPKLIFEITPGGQAALRTIRELRNRLWESAVSLKPESL